MHATGYLDTRSRHPVALIAAISINLAVVGGVLTYKTVIQPRGLEGIPLIPLTKEPDFVKPPELPKARQPKTTNERQMPERAPVDTTKTTIDTTDTPFAWPDPVPPQPTPTDEGTTIKPQPLPVEIGAQIDKRYAGELQPPYPAGLERQEIQGKVTVKVQVGVDGRVTAVELITADDPGFFTATRDQALKRWRFKPATRDGQPIVSWVTKTVVFKINRP